METQSLSDGDRGNRGDLGALVMIRVLGPVDIVTESGPQLPKGRICRKLLAALATSANTTMSSQRLAWRIWGETPPPSWANTLQTYVYRLRCLIGHERIACEDHCYGLIVSSDELDALLFEERSDAAFASRGDPPRCADLCKQAVSLWRGVPFGEFADEDPYRLEAIRLNEIRLVVMELELGAELEMGRSDLVVGTLEALAEEYPYRERIWFLLVTALALCGRRVEAIRAIGRLRSILGEAGLEPALDLSQLENQIVSESPSLRPLLFG